MRARREPPRRSTTSACTRSAGAAYGTNTTCRPWCASASKPKVRRSTSRTSGSSVNPELAQHEEHLLGREQVGGQAPHQVVLDDPARGHVDVARHHLEDAGPEEDRLAPVDGVDGAADLEAGARVARRREEEKIGDRQLGDAPHALAPCAGEVGDLGELLLEIRAGVADGARRDPAARPVGRGDAQALLLEAVQHRRPQAPEGLLHDPRVVATHVLLRVELRAPPAAAEPDGQREGESTPHGASILGERSEEHTSELQSQSNLVCRLLLEKKKKKKTDTT